MHIIIIHLAFFCSRPPLLDPALILLPAFIWGNAIAVSFISFSKLFFSCSFVLHFFTFKPTEPVHSLGLVSFGMSSGVWYVHRCLVCPQVCSGLTDCHCLQLSCHWKWLSAAESHFRLFVDCCSPDYSNKSLSENLFLYASVHRFNTIQCGIWICWLNMSLSIFSLMKVQ